MRRRRRAYKKPFLKSQGFKAIALILGFGLIIKRTKGMINEAEKDEPNSFAVKNYSNGVPNSAHFKLSEFNTNDGTQVPEKYYGNVQKLMNNLEIIRSHFNAPIRINSGYRHPEYNKRVGGATHSQHLTASAADFTVYGHTAKEVFDVIIDLQSSGKLHKGGLGNYSTFVHFDIRNSYKIFRRK